MDFRFLVLTPTEVGDAFRLNPDTDSKGTLGCVFRGGAALNESQLGRYHRKRGGHRGRKCGAPGCFEIWSGLRDSRALAENALRTALGGKALGFPLVGPANVAYRGEMEGLPKSGSISRNVRPTASS